MSVAGVGILKTTRRADAQRSSTSCSATRQRFFAEQTGEFPLAGSVDPLS